MVKALQQKWQRIRGEHKDITDINELCAHVIAQHTDKEKIKLQRSRVICEDNVHHKMEKKIKNF